MVNIVGGYCNILGGYVGGVFETPAILSGVERRMHIRKTLRTGSMRN